MNIVSKKGQPCPLKSITCQEGFCQDCAIPEKKTWCFDCDNTLCFTEGTDYKNAILNRRAIDKVNSLYNEGHTVWICTGRGSKSKIDWRELTETQLKEWGVKYHKLIMGKPPFDIFIDDLAYNTKDWLNDNI